jgi:hypothetical protein
MQSSRSGAIGSGTSEAPTSMEHHRGEWRDRKKRDETLVSETLAKTLKKHMEIVANICNIHMQHFQNA